MLIIYPRAFVDLHEGDDAELQTAVEESLLNVWCVNACITIFTKMKFLMHKYVLGMS